MKILFICKHNRFRSKVAEAIMDKILIDRSIEDVEVRSAGVVQYYTNLFMPRSVVEALVRKGYKIRDEKSKSVDSFLIEWADKIIIVADNVSKDLFPKSKAIVWPVSDTDESDISGIDERIDDIHERINLFVEDNF